MLFFPYFDRYIPIQTLKLRNLMLTVPRELGLPVVGVVHKKCVSLWDLSHFIKKIKPSRRMQFSFVLLCHFSRCWAAKSVHLPNPLLLPPYWPLLLADFRSLLFPLSHLLVLSNTFLVVYSHVRMIQGSDGAVQHRCISLKVDVSRTKLIYVILEFFCV